MDDLVILKLEEFSTLRVERNEDRPAFRRNPQEHPTRLAPVPETSIRRDVQCVFHLVSVAQLRPRRAQVRHDPRRRTRLPCTPMTPSVATSSSRALATSFTSRPPGRGGAPWPISWLSDTRRRRHREERVTHHRAKHAESTATQPKVTKSENRDFVMLRENSLFFAHITPKHVTPGPTTPRAPPRAPPGPEHVTPGPLRRRA